ncbi:PAS domain S-box protein [bacterium]|nr:PAS domain S-box protein [bacterium]
MPTERPPRVRIVDPAEQSPIAQYAAIADLFGRESRGLFHTLVVRAPVALTVFDRDMRHVAVSARWCTTFGIAAEDIVGRLHYDVFPEIPEKAREVHRRCLAGASASGENEPYYHDDGRIDFVDWEIHPWRDASGEVGGIVLFVETRTSAREAEQSLADRDARLRALWEQAADPMFIHALGGGLLDANPEACRLLELDKDDLERRANENAGAVFGEGWDKVLGANSSFEAPVMTEGSIRSAGGVDIPVEIRASLVDTRQGPIIVSIARDIRRRMIAEAALRDLSRFPSENPQPVLRVEPTGRVLYANEAAGYLLKNWGVAIGDRLPARERELVRECMATAEPVREVYEAGERTYEILFSASAGGPHVNIYGNDITERRRVERQLERSEARARMIFKHAPIGFTVGNRDGVMLECNEMMAEIFGRPMSEIVGRSFLDFVPAEIREAARDQFTRLVENNERFYCAERQYLRGDGTRVPARVTVVRMVDPQGEPFQVAMVEDLREQHAAREALLEREHRFRVLYENAADSIILVGADGRFVDVNPETCRTLGYTRDEMIGMTLSAIAGTGYSDETLVGIMEDIEAGRTASYTGRRRRKDGSEFPVDVRLNSIELGGDTVLLIVARDASEQERAEKERLLLQEQLQQAHKMEALGSLAGGVAHDFNNLLSIISGYGDMLAQKIDAENPLFEAVQEIRSAAARAGNLTSRLLAFSRRQVIKRRVVDLRDVVTEVKNLLRRVIGENIELRARLSPEPAPVLADVGQIEQVLVNLAVNSRDAMPNGGVLELRVSLDNLDESVVRDGAKMPAGRYVRLLVADSGTGMDEATRRRVFEPFFTTKERGKGTGLGMAMAFGIVKQHDGFIFADSVPGKGATIEIYLPRSETVLETATGPAPRAPLVRTKGEGVTVMVVEDEIALRRLIRRVLERSGFQVLEAGDGTSAIELLQTRGHDVTLLLTDVVMPNMSGPELARIVREALPHLKVLFMSGYAEDAFERESLDDIERSYIQKPFTSDELMTAIARVIEDEPD